MRLLPFLPSLLQAAFRLLGQGPALDSSTSFLPRQSRDMANIASKVQGSQKGASMTRLPQRALTMQALAALPTPKNLSTGHEPVCSRSLGTAALVRRRQLRTRSTTFPKSISGELSIIARRFSRGPRGRPRSLNVPALPPRAGSPPESQRRFRTLANNQTTPFVEALSGQGLPLPRQQTMLRPSSSRSSHARPPCPCSRTNAFRHRVP